MTIGCKTSRSEILHAYRDLTICGEGPHHLGFRKALMAFEQPRKLRQGALVFAVSSEGRPPLVGLNDKYSVYCGSILTLR